STWHLLVNFLKQQVSHCYFLIGMMVELISADTPASTLTADNGYPWNLTHATCTLSRYRRFSTPPAAGWRARRDAADVGMAVAGQHAGAAAGRRPAGDLQPHAAGGLCGACHRQRAGQKRRPALRVRVQQVQRLAGDQGVAD